MTSVIDHTTVLTPATCLIVAAPFRLRTVWSRPARVKNATYLQIAKLAIALVFVALHPTLVVINSAELETSGSTAELSPSILAFVAALFATVLSIWEHSRSIRPSYVLQTYLLTSLLGRLVHVYADWKNIISASGKALEISLCVITAASLAAESFRKKIILLERKQYSPQDQIGIFGQGLFLWLNRLFKRGYSTVFELDDLDSIDERLSSLDDSRRLRLQWLKARAKYSDHVLLHALCRSLYLDFLLPVVPRVLLLGTTFAQPWLIQRLLQFTDEPTHKAREAVLLASATAATYVCLAVFQSWYWQSVCRAQAKVRFCLTTAIYDKMLRSRSTTSPLTLMNVDTEKVLFGIRPIHEYWASTISIITSLILLYTQIGVCFVAPFVLVFTLATASVTNGIKIGPKQKAWLEATQKRITFISNTLHAMKAIKLYGLVSSTMLTGTSLREKEVGAQKSIRRSLLLNTVISQTLYVALALVTYCAFAVRTRITGEALTNYNLFTSLAILKIISASMLGVVQHIPNTLQCLAAMKRIETFLDGDNQDDQRLLLSPQSLEALSGKSRYSGQDELIACLSKVNCGYTGASSVIEKVDCSFQSGKFHIVTGSLGSGKSTLLKAILGELKITQGSISAPGIIAYCDQLPWLWNATVEENITGPHERDETWLQRVLWACGLDQDMQHMSKGSTVGEGGSSLSGGQKNRKGHDTLQGNPSELGEKLGIVSVSEKVLRIDTTILLADSAAALINPLPTETKSPVSRLRPDSEVYSQYFKSFGFYYTALYFALLALYVGSIQMQSVWLKWWAAAETTAASKLRVQASVFTAISCIAILLSISLFGYSLLSLLARSSLHLHVRQWEALMKVTYVAWITQSIGGVINRFSQDVMIIDTQLANAFINTAMQVCTSIASTVLLIVATPYIGIAVPFLCAIFWVIQHVYLRTSKQLRTLDLEAKAPICAHFLQSASGLASIKAFGWTEDYREMNIQLLRNSQVPYYLLASVQNWLALVLNLVVAGLATAVVSIAFNLKDLDTGYLGLALTGIMDIGFHFEILIQSWTSLETSLGAVARMNQFVNELPQALNFLLRRIHIENKDLIAIAFHPGAVQTDEGNKAAQFFGFEAAFTSVEDSVDGIVAKV
ncbi:P-loop containing nucleoside triphosphate hydrolase protein [Aureobasidium pullulans]|uniref:P-loop containing nucleoside triphosphate hydrolase protein n=1 Tax=Aureobasidium pullulans TaxID=5580 RepID=A0A4S9BYV6_AURPU|nr:P-loop containing nucleoside triphosphate hydrolase protein [Aureobasidium pullulans]